MPTLKMGLSGENRKAHRLDGVLEGRLERLPEVEADGRECRDPNPEGTLLVDDRFLSPSSGASALYASSPLSAACLSLSAACLSLASVTSVICLFRN
jgi:hypothetical protein